jgi:hypothetical protein
MIEEIFPLVCEKVRCAHERLHFFRGHDHNHTFRVAEMAYRIALHEWNDEDVAESAALAGVCHDAGHIMQKVLHACKIAVTDSAIADLVHAWLISEDLFPADKEEIVSAVLEHGKANGDQDSKVLIALKDADRVVNLALDLVIRAGQHYHDLPAVDFEHFLDDPDASYQAPKSVLRDIDYALEWTDKKSPHHIRTSLGRKIGESRATVLRNFLLILQRQLKEEGLLQHIKENDLCGL